MNRLLSELRRRNVFRIAAAYLVVGWVLIQVVTLIEAPLSLPAWTDTLVIVLLGIGFPVAVLLAWAFEMTPEGMQKTTPTDGAASFRPLGGTDFVLIGMMALVLGVVGFQMMNSSPAAPEIQTVDVAQTVPDVVEATITAPQTPAVEASPQAATPPALSVAVLPFVAMSSNENDGYFADGLTEEILNSLAALPELLVTSRTSAFQFKGDDIPSIPEIASQLGVAHVVEGSVRRGGDQVRITVQVIRVSDDSHLWSQTYDRSMDDIFAVQEDIATNIASVLDVVLDEDKRQLMRNTGVDNVEAFIAYQRAMDLSNQAHEVDGDDLGLMAAADPHFAEAIRLAPDFADAYFMQSDQYAHLMLVAGNSGDEDRSAHDAARERYFELLAQAQAVTNDPGRKALLNIERIYWSNNWTGANTMLDQVLNITGCPAAGWLIDMVVLSGRAEEFIPYFEQQARCDPLSGQSWGMLSALLFAAGEYERALAATDHALLLSADNGSSQRARANLLLRTNRLDALFTYLDSRQQSHVFHQLWLASLAGDRGEIQDVFSRNGATGVSVLEDLALIVPTISQSASITTLAQMGERDFANELASEIDASPGATNSLLVAMSFCRCGAPWDLEATPNFAARMAEAEFPWPPPGTGDYPLKDW